MVPCLLVAEIKQIRQSFKFCPIVSTYSRPTPIESQQSPQSYRDMIGLQSDYTQPKVMKRSSQGHSKVKLDHNR